VAVDAEHLYWANGGGDTIGRASITGTSVENRFIPGANWPCGLAVDDVYIYWGNSNAAAAATGPSIGRADLDGRNVDQAFIVGMLGVCGVALDG
jgi:virginiamycin B lyase